MKKLDDLLERASGSDFTAYDPTAVIEAVNALFPLGKDGALKELERFIAGAKLDDDPHHGLFLVMRVLFDADPHPPLRLGGARLEPPAQASAVPRFPIMMVDDVPVMLIEGYTLGGLPEQLPTHIDYYRTQGKLRPAPLAPTPGDKRTAFAQAFQQAYGTPPDAQQSAHVDAQLARLKP
jgi:hypothetical protein